MTRTGDTPRSDPEPALVEHHANEHLAEGDSPRTDTAPAVLVGRPEATLTAGDLRAAGYEVDPKVPDGAVPTKYVADSPTPPGEVRLVADTSTPDDGLAPLERHGHRAGAEVAAPPKAKRSP